GQAAEKLCRGRSPARCPECPGHRARRQARRRHQLAPCLTPIMPQSSSVPHSPKPSFWDEASTMLVKRDRILRKVIPEHDTEWLAPPVSPFVTLARAIVGHQISVKAADAMWQRFQQACGNQPSPERVLELASDNPESIGLSRRKGEYI